VPIAVVSGSMKRNLYRLPFEPTTNQTSSLCGGMNPPRCNQPRCGLLDNRHCIGWRWPLRNNTRLHSSPNVSGTSAISKPRVRRSQLPTSFTSWWMSILIRSHKYFFILFLFTSHNIASSKFQKLQMSSSQQRKLKIRFHQWYFYTFLCIHAE